jgi:hypothetical protein
VARYVIDERAVVLPLGGIGDTDQWAAAGFMDTLLRWKMKLEVVYGNEAAI